MVVHRRKKVVKLRGSKTHGWGAKKKHRGKGHKGGAGRAGSGKRGDAKKPSFWKWRVFGKHGFKKKGLREDVKVVNISYLEDNFDNLVSKKLITGDGGFFVADVSKLGYNKLLGSGVVTKKFKVHVKYASNNAIEKVKKSGGEVILAAKKGVKEKDVNI